MKVRVSGSGNVGEIQYLFQEKEVLLGWSVLEVAVVRERVRREIH